MAAWLRRKDYNPMKAAAEAKKLQQLKTRWVFLGIDFSQFKFLLKTNWSSLDLNLPFLESFIRKPVEDVKEKEV